MSAPVDVLAVMDTVAEHTFAGRAVALREARAAVAELIERERLLREALTAFRDGGPAGGQDFNGWHASYDKPVALARSILARCNGGAP